VVPKAPNGLAAQYRQKAKINMSESIDVENLAKRFEAVEAVAGISFSVRQGELFGFLGPNGAGKTTTINMLTGLARPDKGIIRIGGIDCTADPRAAQHLVGVVPDESNLYPELTGFDNLCFCASLYGMRKADRQARAKVLLDTFDLAPAANRKFAGYSKGMKRKLTIAAGMIHRPQILFLDEPTTGIDVASARHLRQLIADLHQSGTTVFLTTHYIEEAERLCDRVAFIVSGRIVRIDSVENLLQPIRDKHVVRIACEKNLPHSLQQALFESFPELNSQYIEQDLLQVESDHPVPVGRLVRFLEDAGAEVLEARRMRPSLEDVFVRMTGIEAAAMRKEKEKKGGGQ
jgi:ABC-2 type transport system ATP-binding protein